MQPLNAVITGDLVNSTRQGAAETDRAMGVLARMAKALSDMTGADTRFTRHRGDGWQIYLATPGLALRSALVMATGLRADGLGIETRQAIGVGRVDRLPDPAVGLGAALGAGFTISGQSLDAMAKADRLCLATPNRAPFQQALIGLIAWQMGRWSREQAEAVNLALRHPSQPTLAMAAQLGITRQALEARLTSAGFRALSPALLAFEAHDWRVNADA